MQKTEFSNRIYWYNFILCIFIILIHAENTTIFMTQVPVLNRIEYIIVEKIARIAIAGFFMCSGYLFYRNFSWEKVGEKWKSRFFSTVIPFMVWNFLYYIIHYGITKIPKLQGLFGSEEIPFNLYEVFRAVVFYKYNPVFWFLQFLIVFILICPVIYAILRNRWAGLVGIIVVYIIAGGQYIDQYNGTAAAMLNWLFIYMAGGYAGIHGKALIEEGRKRGTLLASSLIIAGASFTLLQIYGSITWTLLYYLSGAICIWYLISYIRLPLAGNWMKCTFYIYAVHFMIVQFGNKLVCSVFGDSMYIGMAMFVILPVAVIIFCGITSYIMSRYVPLIWKLLSGSR